MCKLQRKLRRLCRSRAASSYEPEVVQKSEFNREHETITPMTTLWRILALAPAFLGAGLAPCRAVELKVDREALQRTLKRQLFGGPDDRYFLKGNAKSACRVYADDAQLAFAQDRIVVRVKTHARLGQAVGGACLGFSLAPVSEVSVEPYGEGRDDRVP